MTTTLYINLQLAIAMPHTNLKLISTEDIKNNDQQGLARKSILVYNCNS
jgi:hypothetical protein